MKQQIPFKAAFPATIPVMMGYLSIGMAFGLMLHGVGYGPLWAVLMSLAIYAGSAQFLGCTLLAQGTPLLQIALLIGILNVRHLFYGLSLLIPFQQAGKKKPYLIFSLTDETYALLTSVHPPEGIDASCFYFAIAVLNHLYWVIGSLLGAALGTVLPFDPTGIDFAMTALFVVIAVEQWLSVGKKLTMSHMPAIIGFGSAMLSLLLFGPEQMLIPSLLLMCVLLLLLRSHIEASQKEDTV